jgi:hypothetical protein
VAQVRGAIQAGAIQVARWWRELEFSQNLSSAGGSDRPELKMSSLYFIKSTDSPEIADVCVDVPNFDPSTILSNREQRLRLRIIKCPEISVPPQRKLDLPLSRSAFIVSASLPRRRRRAYNRGDLAVIRFNSVQADVRDMR